MKRYLHLVTLASPVGTRNRLILTTGHLSVQMSSGQDKAVICPNKDHVKEASSGLGERSWGFVPTCGSSLTEGDADQVRHFLTKVRFYGLTPHLRRRFAMLLPRALFHSPSA
jgi:hypothetical protein